MPRFFVEVNVVDGVPDLPSTVQSWAVVEQVGNNRVVVETDRTVASNGSLGRKNRNSDFRQDHSSGLARQQNGPSLIAEPLELQRLRRRLMDILGRQPTAAEISSAQKAARDRRKRK